MDERIKREARRKNKEAKRKKEKKSGGKKRTVFERNSNLLNLAREPNPSADCLPSLERSEGGDGRSLREEIVRAKGEKRKSYSSISGNR